MDTAAVSIAAGLSRKKIRLLFAAGFSLLFGVFQGAFTLAGGGTGATFASFIAAYDHWVVFGILFMVGLKMIYESFDSHQTDSSKDYGDFPVLVLLASATSIDAFAVGIGFAVLDAALLFSSFIIGIVTFIVAAASFSAGTVLGSRGPFWERMAERTGGLILFGIAVKVLTEHISSGI